MAIEFSSQLDIVQHPRINFAGQPQTIIEDMAALSDFGYCLDDERSNHEQFRTCVAEESPADSEFTNCLDKNLSTDPDNKMDHIITCAKQSSNGTMTVIEHCSMLWIQSLNLGCYSDR